MRQRKLLKNRARSNGTIASTYGIWHPIWEEIEELARPLKYYPGFKLKVTKV